MRRAVTATIRSSTKGCAAIAVTSRGSWHLSFLTFGGLAAWLSLCSTVLAVPAGVGVGSLQWSDEFNGSSLNLSNWAYRPWPTEADSNFRSEEHTSELQSLR